MELVLANIFQIKVTEFSQVAQRVIKVKNALNQLNTYTMQNNKWQNEWKINEKQWSVYINGMEWENYWQWNKAQLLHSIFAFIILLSLWKNKSNKQTQHTFYFSNANSEKTKKYTSYATPNCQRIVCKVNKFFAMQRLKRKPKKVQIENLNIWMQSSLCCCFFLV